MLKRAVFVPTAGLLLAGISIVAPVASMSPAQAAPVGPVAANTLPEIVMTCSPGQTDINHASKAALVSVFGLGGPVADRLIAGRPYASVVDLLAVNGIGRGATIVDADHPADPSDPVGKYDQIVAAHNACSTPILTSNGQTPINPNPCTRATQTDVASAGLSELKSAFKLPDTVARRVIAERPYGNLSLLGTDRVPGVGAASQKLIASVGCLTPAPLRTDTASWRWVYPSSEGKVVRDLYALSIPAGVIDESSGAWSSIKPTAPLDPIEFNLVDPAADMHIWGSWADGTDTVTVTLPSAPYLDQLTDTVEWVPLLKHEFADGTDGENVIPSVNPSTSQLSAPTTSLSIWSSIYAIKDVVQGFLLGNRYPAPSCNTPWQQQSNTSDYRSPFQNTHVLLADSQLNLPGNRPTPAGFLMLHCVGGANSPAQYDPSVTRLRDNGGAVYIGYDVQNNDSTWKDDAQVRLSDPGSFLNLFTNTSMALTNFAYLGDGKLLGPGDIVDIATPAGTHGVTRLSPNVPLSILNSAIDLIIGKLLEAYDRATDDAKSKAAEAFAHVVNCMYPVLQAGGESDALTRAREAARAAYDCFITDERLGKALVYLQTSVVQQFGEHSAQAALTATFGKAIWTANKYAAFAKAATSVVDSIVATATQSDFVADHFKPIPTLDAKGRPVQSQCIRNGGSVNPTVDLNCQDDYYDALTNSPGGGGTGTGLPSGFMTQDADHHSYFFNKDTLTYGSIPTPGDYVCFARAQIPVRFYTEASSVPGYTVDGDQKCGGGNPAQEISPTLMDANLADPNRSAIRLLRSASTGITYRYIGNGQIERIYGEDTLQCFSTGTHKYLAYDYVTDTELARFQFLGSNIPLCV